MTNTDGDSFHYHGLNRVTPFADRFRRTSSNALRRSSFEGERSKIAFDVRPFCVKLGIGVGLYRDPRMIDGLCRQRVREDVEAQTPRRRVVQLIVVHIILRRDDFELQA